VLAVSPDSFDAVLEQVYRTTTGEVTWDAALGKVASVFDASFAALAVERCDISQVRLAPPAIVPMPEVLYSNIQVSELIERYYAYYHRLDPFRSKVGVVLSPSILRMHDICDATEFTDSEYYQDLCRLVDSFHLGRYTARLDAALQLRFPLNRSEKFAPLDEGDLALFGALGAHTARALKIQRQVTQMGVTLDAALGALGRTGRAAFLVDRNGKVCRMNASAEAICSLNDGMTIRNQRLLPHGLREQKQLRAALSAQLGEGLPEAPKGPLTITVERPSGSRPYLAEVTPFTFEMYWTTAITATALITIDNPDAKRPRACESWALAVGL
ncbi:unnamed protein product, partial [Ectocarpus sp. 13 AM-2016]